jgi:hypothetical protein
LVNAISLIGSRAQTATQLLQQIALFFSQYPPRGMATALQARSSPSRQNPRLRLKSSPKDAAIAVRATKYRNAALVYLARSEAGGSAFGLGAEKSRPVKSPAVFTRDSEIA